MSLEDQLHISTPEGVDVELTLAGLGSRLGGAILDQLIKFGVELLLFLAFFAFASATSGAMTAVVAGVLVVAAFLITFGYDVLFEVLGSGKTIGKRAIGTRVLRADGSVVDFRSSAIRNLLRIVDNFLVVGIVLILATPRHQRLGDIAAGTIVVRDRLSVPPSTTIHYAFSSGTPHPWDVGGVDRDVIATLRNFLVRRDTLTAPVRGRIARQLYERVRPMVGGVAEDMSPEAFIEEVVRIKSSSQ